MIITTYKETIKRKRPPGMVSRKLLYIVYVVFTLQNLFTFWAWGATKESLMGLGTVYAGLAAAYVMAWGEWRKEG